MYFVNTNRSGFYWVLQKMSREYDQAEIEAVAKRITRERVLLKRLEWNNLCAAGLIDQEELRLISLYDHKTIEQKITFYRDVS